MHPGGILYWTASKWQRHGSKKSIFFGVLYNLKSTAEEHMHGGFDLKEFNTVLLTNGDRPFEMVEEDVNAYIKSGDTSTVISDNKPSDTSINSKTGLMIAGVAAIAAIAAAAYVLHKKKKSHDAL